MKKFEIVMSEGNKIEVRDLVFGGSVYGRLDEKGNAVASSAYALSIITKALRAAGGR